MDGATDIVFRQIVASVGKPDIFFTEFVPVDAILGDFGGASYYESDDSELNDSLERLEVRAFGCLIEELLEISKEDNQDKNIRDFLYQLQISCLNEKINERPLFEQILKELVIF